MNPILLLLLLLALPAFGEDSPPPAPAGAADRPCAMSGPCAMKNLRQAAGANKAAEGAAPQAADKEAASVEIKDPTVMSPRFRDAIKHMVPATTGAKGTGVAAGAVESVEIPDIRLAAKSLGGRGPSAVLGIGKQTFLVQQGGQFSLSVDSRSKNNGESLTVRVDAISEAGVQLTVLPYNRRIFLY